MIYSYKCKDCGHETPDIRKVAERDNECVCEKCQSKETERVIVNEISFELKGKSWYRDGYN